MSFSLMTDVWNLPASPFEKLVLLAIADHVNETREDKTAWPSLNTIARKTGMSRRGVYPVIDRLEEKGWLHVGRGGSPKGEKRESNQYLLTIPSGVSDIPDQGTGFPSTGERGSTVPGNETHGLGNGVPPNHKKQKGIPNEPSAAARGGAPFAPRGAGTPSKKGNASKSGNAASFGSDCITDDWLDKIRRNPAYSDINIDKSLGKFVARCDARGEEVTQEGMVSWLNREKPSAGSNFSNSPPGKRKPNLTPEPSKADDLKYAGTLSDLFNHLHCDWSRIQAMTPEKRDGDAAKWIHEIGVGGDVQRCLEDLADSGRLLDYFLPDEFENSADGDEKLLAGRNWIGGKDEHGDSRLKGSKWLVQATQAPTTEPTTEPKAEFQHGLS